MARWVGQVGLVALFVGGTVYAGVSTWGGRKGLKFTGWVLGVSALIGFFFAAALGVFG
jgi:hypothetical protein